MARKKFGTIRELPSGKFQARYRHNGKRYGGPHSFATERLARGWLNEEEELIAFGKWTPPEERAQLKKQAAEDEARRALTVAELIALWLEKADLKESTRRSHAKRVELRLTGPKVPHDVAKLAHMRVVDVTRQDIRDWKDAMVKHWPYDTAGYSTCFHARKRLVTAFNFAINELELIATNPVSQVEMKTPINRKRDVPVIAPDEATTICKVFAPHLQHAAELMLWTGLRIGELLELRVKDLTGITGGGALIVHVSRNVSESDLPNGGKESIIEDTPKTAAGRRSIVVPTRVANAVREHLKTTGKLFNPEALVVSRHNGNQFTQGNFRDHYFKPAAKAADRPDITPHDTRRFYGTNLVKLVMGGALSMEEARRLMGHETTEQLMEYMRAEVGYQERAAAALNQLAGI